MTLRLTATARTDDRHDRSEGSLSTTLAHEDV